MSNKEAKEKLESMKMEVASELGIPLKKGYNGDLPSSKAGSIGGGMVKKVFDDFKAKR